MAHPAEKYNKVKNVTFSLLNKNGVVAAYKYLNSQMSELPLHAWYGLKAELDFYTKYKTNYSLTPSLDYGIKCDFSGMIDEGQLCRIDVTTNIEYKKLKDYDPIQKKDGMLYKIVVMNKDTGKIEDIFDLNFPPDNHGGKLFDVALFMPMDYNGHGEPRYNPYQRIVTISSKTGNVICEKALVTDWYLPDIHTKMSEIYEAYDDYDGNEDIEGDELRGYLCEAAKLLTKTTDLNIVACGQTNREIIDPRTCEDEEVTRIYWKHPVVKDWIDDVVYDFL